MVHCCPRCLYQSRNKSDLKNHFKRKKPCVVTKTDVDLNECLKLLNLGKLKLNKVESMFYESKIDENKTIKIMAEQIEELKKENKEIKEKMKSQNVYTNCGNTTINNTFTINSFKDTDYSLLKDDIIKCIQDQEEHLKVPMFERIVDAVHFNKDKPENHNIYKPNVRDDRILTYNGNDFIVDKHAIDNMLTKLEKAIEDSADPEENKEIIEKLKQHLKLKRTDSDYINETMDDISVSLYNGKKLVKTTHKTK